MPLSISVKEWYCVTCEADLSPGIKSDAKRHVIEHKEHIVEYIERYVWVTGRQPNYNGLHRG